MRWLEPDADVATALTGDYSLPLVAVSVCAAIVAAYAAIALADRLRHAHAASRAAWLTAGAVTMGGGIWTMHFVGMLAYRLPVPVEYDVVVTLVSMLPAVFAAGIALHVIGRRSAGRVRVLVGGVLMGGGIGLMHFTGMHAMRLPAAMRHDPYLVVVAVLVAVVLATASLQLEASRSAQSWRRVRDWSRILAAIVMGFAVSGMHYTAMAAVRFLPLSPNVVVPVDGWVVAPGELGTVIGLTAVVLMSLLIIANNEVEMLHRRGTERGIRLDNAELERRVAERTGELEHANATLHQRGEELALLNELSAVLQSSVTLDDAADAIRAFAGRMFPETGGHLYCAQEADLYLQRVRSWGTVSATEEVVDRAECWALRRGRIHAISDARTGLTCSHVRADAAIAYICCPLLAHGEVAGLLYLERPTADRIEPPRTIRTLTEQISLALANIRLRETLLIQSTRDPLTGLYNRRYLIDALGRELSRSSRLTQPTAVLILDIDHFKRINDTCGHDAGDTVIRAIADHLRAGVRAHDVVCRYGGEEFVIVLGDSPRTQARGVAEKLRNAVARVPPRHDGRELAPVTVSIGVAVFPDDAPTAERLLEVADRHLYAAKSASRNRVEDGMRVD